MIGVTMDGMVVELLSTYPTVRNHNIHSSSSTEMSVLFFGCAPIPECSHVWMSPNAQRSMNVQSTWFVMSTRTEHGSYDSIWSNHWFFENMMWHLVDTECSNNPWMHCTKWNHFHKSNILCVKHIEPIFQDNTSITLASLENKKCSKFVSQIAHSWEWWLMTEWSKTFAFLKQQKTALTAKKWVFKLKVELDLESTLQFNMEN